MCRGYSSKNYDIHGIYKVENMHLQEAYRLKAIKLHGAMEEVCSRCKDCVKSLLPGHIAGERELHEMFRLYADLCVRKPTQKESSSSAKSTVLGQSDV